MKEEVPNKIPYLEEMSSFLGATNKNMIKDCEPAKDKNKQKMKDFGSILENLNTKLNNYIECNRLEDTYRNFKL